MNLRDLGKLVSLRDHFADSSLEEKYKAAVGELLGENTSERRRKNFAFYTAVSIFVLFGFATGIIALLASLKLIEIDSTSFTLCWGVFGGEMVTVAVWLIKNSNRPKG